MVRIEHPGPTAVTHPTIPPQVVVVVVVVLLVLVPPLEGGKGGKGGIVAHAAISA